MKRQNTETITEVLQRVLRENHLDGHLAEMRLVQAWPVVLGATVQRYTTQIEVRNRVLYVRLSSAALRSELFLGKQQLIASLNREVGMDVIGDIHFL